MSYNHLTEHTSPNSHSKHHAALSVDTNASGIAGSTISFATVSQFPQPPLSIPPSPASFSFPAHLKDQPTPTSSSFLSPFPSSPRSFSEFPVRLKERLAAAGYDSAPSSPAQRSEFPASLKDLDNNDVLSSSSSLITRFRPQDFPTEVSSPSSQTEAQFLPRYPLPPVPKRSPKPTRTPSVKTAVSLSPFDWHEGSSTIDSVDPTEERLLSTSFITSLLSSEKGSPSSTHPNTPGQSHQFAGGDGASSISEVSYPAISSPHAYPPRFQGHGASYWDEGRSSRGSNRTHGDADTLHSFAEDSQPAVVRMASMTRIGPRGAQVVGVAPAVRMHSTTSSTLSDRPSTVRSTMPLLEGFSKREPIVEDTLGEQRSDPDILHTRRSTVVSTTPSPFRRRQSTQSAKTSKSAVSSLVSRITKSTGRALRKIKPLPPVPLIPDMHRSEEVAHKKREAGMALPHLASRADTLVNMLDNGHEPHDSTLDSPWVVPYGSKGEYVPNNYPTWKEPPTPQPVPKSRSNSIWRWSRDAKPRRFVSIGGSQLAQNIPPPESTRIFSITRFGKFRVILVAVVALLIVIIAVVIGVVVGHKKHGSTLPSCPGNSTGAVCDLDATCVCPSSSSDICVAQSILSLTPTVNQLFNANLSTHTVATALWNTQGAPLNGNCAYQAIVIDVGPSLQVATSPNRTAWARSALLWQLVQTVDLSIISDLQSFIGATDFSQLSQDGPVQDPSSKFNSTSAGFSFDFASQTVAHPAVSWKTTGQPSSAQISQVNDIASGALDRMYSFAVASSTQQRGALSKYWQFSLQQSSKDLSTFLSIVAGSPIMIPFDASITSGSSPVEALLSNTTTQFPPPIACYPSLDSNQLNLVNEVETGVFALSPASLQSGFQPSCYANRPLYGIMDVLRLRLPFSDSRNNVAREGVVLQRAVSPRAVVYSGEILSALPHDPSNAPYPLDPRQYGTLNNFEHVMLQYLTSISDINVAISFVQFVLSSPALPPTNSSNLFASLSSLPSLEVAIFGNITGTDVDYVVSSFSSPTNDLFFGSDASLALRNWAITGIQSSVAWTVSSTSAEVVHDSSFDDSLFNAVWNPAFQYMHLSDPGVTVNVNNISSSFQSIGKFSP